MLETIVSVTTILVGLIVFLLVYYFMKYLGRRKTNLPPGPRPLPFIGNLLMFAWAEDPVKMFDDWKRLYGDVYSIWLGSYHAVVLNSLDAITEALVTRQADCAGRPQLHSMQMIFGEKSILFADHGPVLRIQRKIAHHAIRKFSDQDKLEFYLHENFRKLSEEWENKTGLVDPRESITLFTFNIISSMCFGELFEKDDPDFKLMLQITKDFGDVIGNGFSTDFLPDCLRFIEKKKLAKMVESVEVFFGVIKAKIQKHRATFDGENLRDLVDHILHVEEQMIKEGEDASDIGQLTDDHFVQIINDVFGGGTDTTRESLRWMILYCAAVPDVQNKMAAELDREVGNERLPTLKDLVRLPYCEAVVYETLRFSSLLPMAFPHKTMCDTSVGGYDIPKSALILLNLQSIHNDPAHWNDPEKFMPERFLDEDGSMAPKPRAWMPFSGGRRVCVGESLAKRELTYIAALIFHQFSILMPEVPSQFAEPESNSIIFRIAKPYKVVMKKRH